MRRQHFGISWSAPGIGLQTHGPYISSTLKRKDSTPNTQSPTRHKEMQSGQKLALGDAPCHGDVFHIQHQCEMLSNSLARVASGSVTPSKALEADAANETDDDDTCSAQLAIARQAEQQAVQLARVIKTLVHWSRARCFGTRRGSVALIFSTTMYCSICASLALRIVLEKINGTEPPRMATLRCSAARKIVRSR